MFPCRETYAYDAGACPTFCSNKSEKDESEGGCAVSARFLQKANGDNKDKSTSKVRGAFIGTLELEEKQ